MYFRIELSGIFADIVVDRPHLLLVRYVSRLKPFFGPWLTQVRGHDIKGVSYLFRTFVGSR